MKPILEFQGEYRWLNNFWPALVTYDGEMYLTVEHAYQAAKTTDKATRKLIANSINPSTAKHMARNLELRPNWNMMKLSIMTKLTTQKFMHPYLRDKLLATGDAEIIEGNTWNDTFWGVCRGKGHNHLGKIIIQIREELRK